MDGGRFYGGGDGGTDSQTHFLPGIACDDCHQWKAAIDRYAFNGALIFNGLDGARKMIASTAGDWARQLERHILGANGDQNAIPLPKLLWRRGCHDPIRNLNSGETVLDGKYRTGKNGFDTDAARDAGVGGPAENCIHTTDRKSV